MASGLARQNQRISSRAEFCRSRSWSRKAAAPTTTSTRWSASRRRALARYSSVSAATACRAVSSDSCRRNRVLPRATSGGSGSNTGSGPGRATASPLLRNASSSAAASVTGSAASPARSAGLAAESRSSSRYALSSPAPSSPVSSNIVPPLHPVTRSNSTNPPLPGMARGWAAKLSTVRAAARIRRSENLLITKRCGAPAVRFSVVGRRSELGGVRGGGGDRGDHVDQHPVGRADDEVPLTEVLAAQGELLG